MGVAVILSERLTALAQMVTPGSRVCDVGCDHGYLSIWLVQKGICPSALAMDVRTGPLSRAREHIADYGLEKYIETRLSDGLMALRAGEAESLVCAGMGGRLMGRILTQSRPLARELKELILQPQSELPFFRELLRKEGYRTVEENMIEEEGKFYFLMKAVPAHGPVPCGEPLFDLFGRQLLEERHPALKRYLEQRQGELQGILDALDGNGNTRARERTVVLNEELRAVRCGLKYFK